ncbi:P-loop containing nucleoside triphosphate hydrolase protein [Obba rivulosa]|uniref:P-loop containing nucleoside triphosphate hydrolase protein n=1 Tax=Obba rivulosa TaxID=1052685 RepID=A0A8E2DR03_9APHY|nr:P-loop containing nucleoside triphosphate hydrolase protein [Obba rivulosa]
MDFTVLELAEYLIQRLQSTPVQDRLLVGISGVPASGKSTLAQRIVDHVNARFRGASPGREPQHEVGVLVGLDGWHLTRAQLDKFPDSKLAHDRRGAHWTFDGESYVAFVRALRRPNASATSSDVQPAGAGVIYAPSFSHAIKDPTPDAVPIHPYHRLVLIEGLYTFLGIAPWHEAAELLDERWWIDVGEEEAEKRLITRHVQSGVAKDLEEAIWRSRENDVPNGRFIKENMLEPTRVVGSIEDPVLKAT